MHHLQTRFHTFKFILNTWFGAGWTELDASHRTAEDSMECQSRLNSDTGASLHDSSLLPQQTAWWTELTSQQASKQDPNLPGAQALASQTLLWRFFASLLFSDPVHSHCQPAMLQFSLDWQDSQCSTLHNSSLHNAFFHWSPAHFSSCRILPSEDRAAQSRLHCAHQHLSFCSHFLAF